MSAQVYVGDGGTMSDNPQLLINPRRAAIRARGICVITAQDTETEHGGRRCMAVCTCGWTCGHQHKRKKRVQTINCGTCRHLNVKANRSGDHKANCPTPRKKRFPTYDVANEQLGKFWATGRGKVMPTRVYECDCGGWHLTSKPLRTPYKNAS